MNPRLSLVVPSMLAALLLGACSSATTNDDPGSSQTRSDGRVELDATSRPPWPAPTDDVSARVAAAGLDLGPMGTAEHYHPHLEIVLEGEQVEVPANIGVDPATGAMSAVHTHESDGTIHIEADTEGEVFTLGQLFMLWGIELTQTQVGGVTATTGETVTLTSNGTPVTGDPRDLRLEADQEIVLSLP